MKVVLVYPLIGFSPSYGCGLGYIASVLMEEGHDVTYLRLQDEQDVRDLYRRIETVRPALIGFSATSCQFGYLSDIIAHIKTLSDAFVVCGGLHPTLKPECLGEIDALDAIVRGEGEFPMRELAAALERKTDYLGIQNIWFRKGRQIIQNDLRPLIPDLDVLPFPYKEPHDYQSVIDGSGGMHRMIFSRGCTFGCPYCSNKPLSELYRHKGNYFRQRSPQKAIEEIERDSKRFKFRFIFFDDDTITLNRGWFFEFFGLYKQKFCRPFCCNLRPGIVDEPMVKLLKEAGATAVAVGVEHGNEEFRKSVLKRDITNQQIVETVRRCQQAGIAEVFAQIMIGLPFEDVDLYLDTVRLCRQLNITPFKYIYQPYPGTDLGRICEQNRWLPDQPFFREREDAVIDYPTFRRRDIQLCYDVFTILVRHKSWPLHLPLVPISGLFRFYKLVNSHLLPWLRRVRQSLRHLGLGTRLREA